MQKKKEILFAYNAMNIGGSTTSLLSILNRLDYSKYNVDLLLNENSGELLSEIPSEVNILPAARKYSDRRAEYFHRLLSPKYMTHFLISKWIAYRDKCDMHGIQYREWKDIEFFRTIDKEYDVAIAFLEGDRCKFVARHIKAKRKVAWIHVDYRTAHFSAKYDKDTMCMFDKIILVSQKCKESFDLLFPELSGRSCIIENILVSEYVRKRSIQNITFHCERNKINLVTVCRIAFESKALDRTVYVIKKLKDENKTENLIWYIIGDGKDRQQLEQIISEAGLSDIIILLGSKTNPYSYLACMSLFFLPSRFEGKPMAVTEGFMMGLPALVTQYSSACEQVRDGVDGMIVENSEDGIYQGLKYIAEHPEKIEEWKKNVLAYDYSNVEEIKKVEAVIDGNI